MVFRQLISILSLFVTSVMLEPFLPICRLLMDGNYRHPGDCTKYVRCREGFTSVRSCEQIGRLMSVWSPTYGRCVFTSFPTCQAVQRYCPRMPNSRTYVGRDRENLASMKKRLHKDAHLANRVAVSNFTCTEKEDRFPVLNDRSSFQACINGKSIIGRCGNTQVYDPELKMCVSVADLGDSMEFKRIKLHGNEICGYTKNDGIYGYSGDCSFFQVCCGFKSYMYRCPLGLEFDIQTNTCTHPDIASCRG